MDVVCTGCGQHFSDLDSISKHSCKVSTETPKITPEVPIQVVPTVIKKRKPRAKKKPIVQPILVPEEPEEKPRNLLKSKPVLILAGFWTFILVVGIIIVVSLPNYKGVVIGTKTTTTSLYSSKFHVGDKLAAGTYIYTIKAVGIIGNVLQYSYSVSSNGVLIVANQASPVSYIDSQGYQKVP
jgi:hypothetical protein